MPDEEIKSAYELAMERLREKDADEGGADRPLNDSQKRAIAEARKACEAKLAELEILYRSKKSRAFDPESLTQLQEEYRRDVQRAGDDRDRRIARIRKGE